MLARNLSNAPSADELPIVAGVMFDDLTHCGLGDLDCDRVSVALNKLGRSQDVWPTVAQVRRALPSRERGTVAYLPDLRKDDRERGSKAIADILAGLVPDRGEG